MVHALERLTHLRASSWLVSLEPIPGLIPELLPDYIPELVLGLHGKTSFNVARKISSIVESASAPRSARRAADLKGAVLPAEAHIWKM